jgi:hypothetical protein
MLDNQKSVHTMKLAVHVRLLLHNIRYLLVVCLARISCLMLSKEFVHMKPPLEVA